MATLHLLCGKIASGKSTLATRLAEAPNTVRLSGVQGPPARTQRRWRT